MRVPNTSYLLSNQPAGQYRFQMLQASLKTPIRPISTYSSQPFYLKQQKWTEDTGSSLSVLYQSARAVSKSVQRLNLDDSSSAINSRVAVQQVHGLVKDFNKLNSLLTEKAGEFAFDLGSSFGRITQNNRSALEQIGIELHREDGSLFVDEAVLLESVSNNFDTVQRVLGGSNGFALRIHSEAEWLQNSPLGTLSRSAQAQWQQNPYQSYRMTSLFYQEAIFTGLFFSQTL